MKSFQQLARITLAALGTCWALYAPAQTVYRCGNSYSQTPCPGAVTIQADDPRSEAQRSAAREGVERDMALGRALETTRRKEEAQAEARYQAAAAANAKAAAQAQAEAKRKEREEAKASLAARRVHGVGKKARHVEDDKNVFTVIVDTGKPKPVGKSAPK